MRRFWCIVIFLMGLGLSETVWAADAAETTEGTETAADSIDYFASVQNSAAKAWLKGLLDRYLQGDGSVHNEVYENAEKYNLNPDGMFLTIQNAAMMERDRQAAEANKRLWTVGEQASICDLPDQAQQRKYYQDFCWYCGPFNTMLSVVKNVSKTVFNAVRSGAVKLLGIGFALWLAWTVVFYFFKPNAPGEFIKKIGTMTFKALFAIALLQISSDALSLIYGPGVGIATDYGKSYFDTTGESYKTYKNENVLDMIQRNFVPINADGQLDESSMMGVLNRSVMNLFADATTMMRFALKRGWIECVLPLLEPFFVAILVAAIAVLVLILFPLKVIDALMRLSVLMILTPLLIVAWVFPATKEYAKKGWDMFMGVMVFILVLGITLAVSLKLLDIAIRPYIQVLSGKMTEVERTWTSASIELMVLLGTCLFVLKLISSTNSLAQEIGGSEAGGGIGSGAMASGAAAGVTAMAGTMVKGTGKTVLGAKNYLQNKASAKGDEARGEKKQSAPANTTEGGGN